MYNLLVFGAGRSGTSTMMGLLEGNSYYMGSNLYEPRDTNPKGFFESNEINAINENIISLSGKNRPTYFQNCFKHIPTTGQRWLYQMPLNQTIKSNYELNNKIEQLCIKQPFCYKDPRISYTLPLWEKYLPTNTKYIILFRHPSSTIKSILKEVDSATYLQNFKINKNSAEKVWLLMYQHILKNYTNHKDRYLFIHYEQLLDGSKFDFLEKKLQIKLYKGFIDINLYRNKAKTQSTLLIKTQSIYNHLCNLAEYKTTTLK